MGEVTGISWCHHTFNPWIGCTKISPACDGCYAAALMGEGGRMGRVVWGEPGKGAGTRSRTAPSNWKQPLKWDRQAKAAGEPRYVFCSSLADVFDNEAPEEWRRDLFDLIRATPNLTWLMLTKRPGNIVKMFASVMNQRFDLKDLWPRNAAIGTTIEDRPRLEQNAPALGIAASLLNPAFTFWSCEPLLEDLGDVSALLPDWVITGGETDQRKHKARPQHPSWFRSLRDQCAAAGVPYHHKQNGEWVESFFPTHWISQEGELHEVGTGVWASYAGIARVGKHLSGRLLDGVLHDAMPVRR